MSPVQGNWFRTFSGKNILWPFCDDFLDQTFLKKWTSEGSSEGVCQVKKGSYIDPLVMRCSLKSDSFIGNVHQNFNFFGKALFSVFTIQKISSKENSDFPTFFRALFLLCCRWSLCFQEKQFLENKDPGKRILLNYFWQFLSKCPNVILLNPF